MGPNEVREAMQYTGGSETPLDYATTDEQAQMDEVADYLAERDRVKSTGLGLTAKPQGGEINRGVVTYLPEAGEKDLFGEDGLKELNAAIEKLEHRLEQERREAVARVEDGEAALAEMKRAALTLVKILNPGTVVTNDEHSKAA